MASRSNESPAAQDHVTTIRRAIPGAIPSTSAAVARKRRADNDALVALDELAAENENAREALAAISRQVSWCNHGEADRGSALAEIDRIASEALRGR